MVLLDRLGVEGFDPVGVESVDAAPRVVRLRSTLVHRDSCGCGHPEMALT